MCFSSYTARCRTLKRASPCHEGYQWHLCMAVCAFHTAKCSATVAACTSRSRVSCNCASARTTMRVRLHHIQEHWANKVRFPCSQNHEYMAYAYRWWTTRPPPNQRVTTIRTTSSACASPTGCQLDRSTMLVGPGIYQASIVNILSNLLYCTCMHDKCYRERKNTWGCRQ